MTSARHHTDQTHSDATPTESMVTLPAHDACQPQDQGAHQWRVLEETRSTILLRCDRCHVTTNNAALASIHPCKGDETTRIILPGPLADPVPRFLDDPSFVSPEVLKEKLRALYPHYCRAINCGNVVDHCGDHCQRCVSEIDALRKHYDEQDRKAARIGWTAIGAIVVFVCALLAGCWWLGQALRGWL